MEGPPLSADVENMILGGIDISQLGNLRIGVKIQDNGNPPGFLCEDCSIYHKCHTIENEDTMKNMALKITCNINKDAMDLYGCRPNRCPSCSKQLKHWLISNKYKKRLIEKFDRRRHHHIRLITWGWLGERLIHKDDIGSKKLVRTPPIWNRVSRWPKTETVVCNCPIARARKEMVAGFKALREHKLWGDHCDGGIWFFECTEESVGKDQVHINPHMHLVVLCPKFFPVKEFNDIIFDEHGLVRREGTRLSKLGRCFINHSRNKDGTIKKSTAKDAANYCVSYAKRPSIKGKMRNQFGIMTE